MAYSNITLAQLQTLLSARFDSPIFWTSSEQTDALNEALSWMQLAAGRWRQRFILTTVANRCFYDVTTLAQLQVGGICQVLQPVRMAFNGNPPLRISNWFDLDFTITGWQAQTTATPGCPAAPAMWGPAGLNLFFIWPADAAGNNSLQMDCLSNSPQLVLPGDFVNLDSTEVVELLNFGEWRLSFKRGGIFWQRTFPLLESFVKMLVARNGYLANVSIFRQIVGANFARNAAPRRFSERTGRPFGVGLR